MKTEADGKVKSATDNQLRQPKTEKPAKSNINDVKPKSSSRTSRFRTL